MRRRDLIAAWPLWNASAGAEAAAGAQHKTLQISFPAPETVFDPVQTNSDLYASTVIAQILEAPLCFDYLARPVKLLPATAVALPQVSGDGRRFRFQLQSGIYFADDAAFRGRRRELTAADYVYAIKRFYDPKYNSSDL